MGKAGRNQFQLTRPARVATGIAQRVLAGQVVSTHATRTGRDNLGWRCRRHAERFNSRDPHGSRLDRFGMMAGAAKFQLTRPARVATRACSRQNSYLTVSTHATRTGRDKTDHGCGSVFACFNSRDPHGSRPPFINRLKRSLLFQLTRPARVATSRKDFIEPSLLFQLTRPARVATANGGGVRRR